MYDIELLFIMINFYKFYSFAVDYTRVLLREVDNSVGADYINANIIRVIINFTYIIIILYYTCIKS